jgi:para-aminobenzoate synthetase component 1
VESLKARILNWGNQFGILAFFDSNSYPSRYGRFECIAGVGAKYTTNNQTLRNLQEFHELYRDWMFGHICYEYKDLLEPKLYSNKDIVYGYPLLQFFVPETVCYIPLDSNIFFIETFGEPNTIYKEILAATVPEPEKMPTVQFEKTISKEAYLNTIDILRRHIAEGDCYEINYCIGALAKCAQLDPILVFRELNRLSPAPFAAYYRLESQHLMCASPERYLRKTGDEVLSQPIKGTARRGKTAQQDAENKSNLLADIKERAENIMITDLVRNDLARCCKTGSIQVDELFGIYTYPQVHQMISTVSGTLTNPYMFTDALKCTFPMGSMTGAPKHMVMQLTETYETMRRELFSGCVGYVTPQGDFDFNVVIRSLFYNTENQILSWYAGGAITWDSIPEKEWDEMQLKAWALERIFSV